VICHFCLSSSLLHAEEKLQQVKPSAYKIMERKAQNLRCQIWKWERIYLRGNFVTTVNIKKLTKNKGRMI
jgi:hypothetical protein